MLSPHPMACSKAPRRSSPPALFCFCPVARGPKQPFAAGAAEPVMCFFLIPFLSGRWVLMPRGYAFRPIALRRSESGSCGLTNYLQRQTVPRCLSPVSPPPQTAQRSLARPHASSCTTHAARHPAAFILNPRSLPTTTSGHVSWRRCRAGTLSPPTTSSCNKPFRQLCGSAYKAE
jgi:hypothetical protein